TIPQEYFRSEIVAFYNEEFYVFLFALAVVLSLIFAICLHGKPEVLVCGLVCAAFISPAILSFNIPSVPAFAAMVSTLVAQIPVGYATKAGMLSRRNEKKKHKQTRKLQVNTVKPKVTSKKSIFGDKVRVYGRHGIAAGLCALICALSFVASSFIIPKESYLSFEKAIDKVAKIGENIADRLSYTLGIGDLSLFSGSGAGGLSVTNLLSVQNPSTSDRQVLKVSSDEPMQFFLRSSIGVDFNNNGWTSISQKQDNEYRKLLDQGFQVEDTAINFYRMNRDDFSEPYSLGGTGLDFCNINIKYLAPSRTVFMPVSSYNVDMLNNNYMTIHGDTTGRFKEMSSDMSMYVTAVVPNGTDFALYQTYQVLSPRYTDLQLNVEDKVVNDGVKLDEIGDVAYGDGTVTAPAEYAKKVYLEGQYREQVEKYYLGVPNNMKSDMLELATEVTKNQATDYDKVLAINQHLKMGYSYSLDPQQTQAGYDDVRNFLFVSKQGHCALYASAMVLMARSLDIPARYAAGFSADTRKNLSIEGESFVILKESNFHAWAEVYFDGIGWIPFDPTGISRSNYSSGEVQQTTRSSTTTTTTTTTTTKSTTRLTPNSSKATSATATKEDGGTEDARTPKSVMLVIIILVAIVMPAVLIGVITRYANHKQQRKRNSFVKSEPNSATKEMYSYLLKLLKLSKYEPQQFERPHDFAKRIDKAMYMSNSDVNFSQLMPIFERREFGDDNSKDITEQERKSALKYLDLLYDDLVNRNTTVKKVLLKLKL
ncbi:MAG TPA: transglutaminase-like domain-containing protein, partial [Oscillospiraceae bacterium]|nr:transglutaminase-like domain-containing protein [Oscillospiraceae bacterium]